MEGILRKKSSWLGRMDSRYFKLGGAGAENNVLVYWERKGDMEAGKQPKGQFVVVPSSGLKLLDNPASSFALTVASQELGKGGFQELTLQAESDAERSQWMTCLNGLIGNVRQSSKTVARKARRDELAAKYGLDKK